MLQDRQRKSIKSLSALAVAATLFATNAFGQAPPVQEPSSQEDIEAALTGGVPMGRWKEGLTFEGISPQPWLKSAARLSPLFSRNRLFCTVATPSAEISSPEKRLA